MKKRKTLQSATRQVASLEIRRFTTPGRPGLLALAGAAAVWLALLLLSAGTVPAGPYRVDGQPSSVVGSTRAASISQPTQAGTRWFYDLARALTPTPRKLPAAEQAIRSTLRSTIGLRASLYGRQPERSAVRELDRWHRA